jgi:hypothetical protein
MTAVQARVHYAFKQELQLLAAIIRDYTDESYNYDPGNDSEGAKKEDYSQVDIIPVSDPNAATMSQRVVQYQAVIQMAQMAPEIYDLPQLHRAMLDVLGIKNAEKLVPLPDDMKPKDPVTENMDILKCEPLKAFIFQDHESHIKTHMALSQDPMVMQLIGQNPKAQQMMTAGMAHIAEHAAYAYRQKIEQAMGMALPPEDSDTRLPPEIQNAMAAAMAQAAQQVLQQNQAQQAQEQAQQAQQDPIVQMQQQELQIRQQEVQIKQLEAQIKERKLAADSAAKADELEIKRAQVEGTLELGVMQAQNKAKDAQDKLAAQQELEGTRMGIDIAKSKAQTQQKPTK